MTHRAPPRAASGALLLVDIGGYTSFLQAVAFAHRDDAFAAGAIPDAYAMISSLLDGIVERVVPPFTLSKIEGDAVFAYAADDALVPEGQALLDCMEACYRDFRARLGLAHDIWTCTCDACKRIDELDLKFILHAGPFVIQDIAGGAELIGPEVVMAHRLLKTRAAELVGHPAYALVTAPAATRYGVPSGDATAITETYDHYAPIEGFVFRLRAA